jgi:26S proteasome non-ATPase regulatory subunit 9
VSAYAGDELPRVAAALQRHENAEIEALFLRQGLPVRLALTPRRWEGRGLLGCHLRPLGQQQRGGR